MAWHAFGTYLRRFALVVSGRYHVLIFAAMAGVPALALPSNTYKIDGLLDLLGRPRVLVRSAGDLRALLGSGFAAGHRRGTHPALPGAGPPECRAWTRG